MELRHGRLKDHTFQPLLQVGVDSKVEVNFWDSLLIGGQKTGVGLFCTPLPHPPRSSPPLLPPPATNLFFPGCQSHSEVTVYQEGN